MIWIRNPKDGGVIWLRNPDRGDEVVIARLGAIALGEPAERGTVMALGTELAARGVGVVVVKIRATSAATLTWYTRRGYTLAGPTAPVQLGLPDGELISCADGGDGYRLAVKPLRGQPVTEAFDASATARSVLRVTSPAGTARAPAPRGGSTSRARHPGAGRTPRGATRPDGVPDNGR